MGLFIDPNGFAAYDNIQVLQSAAVATGVGATMKTRGYEGVLIDVTGTFVGTITIQGTDINGAVTNLTVTNIATGAQTATITASGTYSVEFIGIVSIVANITAYTSGTINVFAAQAQASVGTGSGAGASAGAPGYTRLEDGVSGALATVAQFHNNDNQIVGTGNGLLTGGVAQLLNLSGNLDRQRGVTIDGIPAVGISTGAAQFAMSFLTTDSTDNFTAGTRTFTPVSMSGSIQSVPWSIQIGSVLSLDTGANQENVMVTAVTTTTFTCVTTKTHNGTVTPFNISGFVYNQERDASGELDGASGSGTAVAAEFEYNGGGPLLNTGFASNLNFDRARNLQGKGVGSATQSAGGAAGALSITVSSAAATNSLQPGQQIRLDRNTGTEEAAYVAKNYTPGTALVPLQSALQFTHTAAAVEWDIFAVAGPGLTGFTPAGIGIEEEALYNPVDGKYYIERSATQDAVAGANVVMESPAILNPAGTFDRAKGKLGAAFVNPEGQVPTYSTSITSLAAVNGDVFTIAGSGTKTVRITKIQVSGAATAAGIVDMVLAKRSAADTAGTSTAPAIVPHDSADAAATAVVAAYTAAPTPGTLVGNIAARKVVIPALTSPAYTTAPVIFDFTTRSERGLVLRGVAQQLALNIPTVPAGGAFDIEVTFTEE